jgi:hypothetical protein
MKAEDTSVSVAGSRIILERKSDRTKKKAKYHNKDRV